MPDPTTPTPGADPAPSPGGGADPKPATPFSDPPADPAKSADPAPTPSADPAKPADPAAPPADPAKPTDPTAASWPDDWRQTYAKEDPAKLNVLKRYASPEAALDALFAARAKISSGDLTPKLGDNPSEAELTEWRKANGIPDKPDGYEIKLSDNRVVGDDDKPIVGKFLEAMHKTNAPPAVVNSALDTYYALLDEQMADRQALDATARQQAEDALRAEYGTEYRANINAVRNFLGSGIGGKEVNDALMGARRADGTPLLSDPSVVRFLVNAVREVNPVASLMPAGSPGTEQSLNDEISSIEAMMADPKSDWGKTNEAGERLQKRYLDLVAARDKLQKRAA